MLPTCKICGADGTHLIGNLGFVCDACFSTNALANSLTERNKFEQEHEEIFKDD